MTATALHELGLVELRDRLHAREVSAREVVEDHLARVERVNPALNAVVTVVAEQALAAADEADRRAAGGSALPPLHGIPMTHKDTHATAGVRTTMGSPLLSEQVPGHSDLVVQRLWDAGVICTGKNNVPEFAAGSHTFNPVFGATGNPYDTDRSVGGSSGGAAATLAARMQTLADGSDMGGSLRNPAAWCNVVGLRPSPGVVPTVPAANPEAWLSRNGLMARSVDDLALGMSVVAGPHPDGPLPSPVAPGSFLALLDDEGPDDLRGVRVGVSVDLGVGVPVAPEVRRAVLEQAEVLASLGATVEESAPRLTDADEVFDVYRAFEMATNLRRLVREHTEDGLVKEDVVWNVRRGLELRAEQLMSAAEARGRLDAAVRGWFGEHDLLLTPTVQVMPFPTEETWPREIDGVQLETYVEWMRSCSLVSATRCPAVSVPGGFVDGLPVGLQLVGAPWSDDRLLRLARVYERATRYAERAPQL
ncbi:amidase [Ornithinimicrobium pekingense]|uniref:Amidase n=1 Tax=Ornithinimicrobium pekingense TaxID=384677 RepID=A0ABQ2FCS3_9MICO|nr:amidase family protein [Ornithinimicrobium pekingense]GGK80704.1 amidase [Ornithinimicrobium pekingense]